MKGSKFQINYDNAGIPLNQEDVDKILKNKKYKQSEKNKDSIMKDEETNISVT